MRGFVIIEKVKKTPLRKKSKSPLRKLKDKLWELCKQITRLRHGNTCFTCSYNPLEGSNWHTGHFIPDSTSSVEVRYDLNNLRPQCRNCNFWKSGDWPTYEANLIRDHGPDYVANLKAKNRDTNKLMYR
jgi:5-methylcytosine-specific restriction endonuclease McrA